MFLIFSKEKIYTYVISFFMVMLLFFVASNFSTNSKEAVETSSNIVNDVEKLIENE